MYTSGFLSTLLLISGEKTWSKVRLEQISITFPFEAHSMTKQQQTPQEEKI